MPLNLTDDKSTLVQVKTWCRQAPSHYPSQCWPRFMSPYGVTRPQWVNTLRLERNGCHLAENVFKCIFLKGILIWISLKFVTRVQLIKSWVKCMKNWSACIVMMAVEYQVPNKRRSICNHHTHSSVMHMNHITLHAYHVTAIEQTMFERCWLPFVDQKIIISVISLCFRPILFPALVVRYSTSMCFHYLPSEFLVLLTDPIVMAFILYRLAINTV